MNTMRWVWIVAWVAAAATAGAMHLRRSNGPPLEGGVRGAVLALELARTVPGADRAVARAGGVEGVSRHLRGDRVFIGVYVILYALLGVLLSRRIEGPLGWVAVAGVAAVALTGALDVLENGRIAAFVGASSTADRAPLLDAMRSASLLKWAAFFLAVALLGVPLWHSGGPRAAVGALYLLVAAVGALGVAGPRAAIEWALTLALAAALPSFAAMWTLWRGA
jgi:hypothetical protein